MCYLLRAQWKPKVMKVRSGGDCASLSKNSVRMAIRFSASIGTYCTANLLFQFFFGFNLESFSSELWSRFILSWVRIEATDNLRDLVTESELTRSSSKEVVSDIFASNFVCFTWALGVLLVVVVYHRSWVSVCHTTNDKYSVPVSYIGIPVTVPCNDKYSVPVGYIGSLGYGANDKSNH